MNQALHPWIITLVCPCVKKKKKKNARIFFFFLIRVDSFSNLQAEKVRTPQD